MQEIKTEVKVESIPITNFRNAKYITESRINVDIEHPVYGWIPYTLDPTDTDMTINNDDLLALIGDDVIPWVPPTQEEIDAKKAEENRYLRDFKLQREVDPVVANVLRWADMPQVEKDAWITYRKALLNISTLPTWPNLTEEDWPIKPD